MLFLGTEASAQTSILWGNLEQGPYPVGFKVLSRLDTSRQIAPRHKARPVQISLWYPARHSTKASPLTYRDYLLLSAHELDFENVSSEDENTMIEQYSELLQSNGISVPAIEAWLDVRMVARPEIEHETGSFPLIIVAQGNFQSAHHQAILSEYLASHGYIVATSPSPMRISGPITDSSQILSYAQQQASDMAFIFNTLKHRNNVKREKFGLVGHSFGARAALLLLTKMDRADALVSLDGGIANKIGKDWLDGYSFKPELITVPILHFYQDIEEFVVPNFSFLETLKSAPRYLIKIDRMRHLYFTSLGMATAMISGFAPSTVRQSVVQQNYETLCQCTLHFLDAYLKGNKKEQELLFSGNEQQVFPETFHLTQMQSSWK